MRINKFVALATGMSRRAADKAVLSKLVIINGQPAIHGQEVESDNQVLLNGKILKPQTTATLILNKPVGYVCSRNGQGSKTIYELLPAEFHNLKPAGRLDKDSSGLLLLTNHGQQAQQMTHPSFAKLKTYEVRLNQDLEKTDQAKIEDGILLDDGLSKLKLSGAGKNWTVQMHEGRNRQIRRTFSALNHFVNHLHRTQFGPYNLKGLGSGKYRIL